MLSLAFIESRVGPETKSSPVSFERKKLPLTSSAGVSVVEPIKRCWYPSDVLQSMVPSLTSGPITVVS